MPSIVPFRFSRTACAVSLALAFSGTASSALAAGEGSALENMLVRDSKVDLQLRTYFYDKLNPAPKNPNQAWALGGWLAISPAGWAMSSASASRATPRNRSGRRPTRLAATC